MNSSYLSICVRASFALALFVGLVILSAPLVAANSFNAASEIALSSSSDVISSDPNLSESPQAHSHVELEEASEDHGSGHHGPDTSPLFFIIMAVFIGAATRHFLKAIPVPFTALLLIIGIVIGVLNRAGLFMMWGDIDVSFIHDSIIWAANIDPHMLFFVFLPILIFEAAFAMDLHTFKKSAANSVILAVPGILIALVLTGVIVYAVDYFDIGLEGWSNWALAFMFGSVISATDPVAVVALLKELGASKKLGTLIEGESLLNDGTAIVLFMVFFLGISGEASSTNGFVSFIYVSFGGLAVGLLIGWIVLRWLKGVFNDAMVEISVVVAAAYVTFYIAEDFLHVSGVLALVSLGLLIGGFGRSSISPQVEHFMHEFWELAGFIANCLIFLIVGLVVASRTEFSADDFLVLAIVYVGIHVVRAIVIAVCYPFMKNTGYGLPWRDAVVVWYGGLRGAIALALALIVVGVDSEIMAQTLDVTPALATKIKDQFLFLIAGTVTLTLLVNATTVKMLVERLGLLDLPPAKALMIKASSEYLRSSAESHVQKLKADRHLRRANWSTVTDYLPKEIGIIQDIDEGKLVVAKMAELRTRILEKEKSSYWRQFKEGMLGAEAVRTLSDTVNEILDNKGEVSLSDRKDLEDLWRPPAWLTKVQQWPVIGRAVENSFFDRLAVSYDCAVGFVKAQEDSLSLIESLHRAEDEAAQADLAIIEQEIKQNIISGQTFMRNLRHTYPEIYRAIATRQAIRSVLNFELTTVERLKGKGRLNASEVAKVTAHIETRMKKLLERPPSVELPETEELIRSLGWLDQLPKVAEKLFVDLCQTRMYTNGQRMVKQLTPSQGFFIVARGTAMVKEGKNIVAIIGKGDGIGEVVSLSKVGTNYSVIAETPVTVLWLSANHLEKFIAAFPEFEDVMWRKVAGRLAIRALQKLDQYKLHDKKQLRQIGEDGRLKKLEPGQVYSLSDDFWAVMMGGAAVSSQNDKLPVLHNKRITLKEIRAIEMTWIWEIPNKIGSTL